MTNTDSPNLTKEWAQINIKWWGINLALWLLLALIFLYLNLPATPAASSDMLRDLIVGGLIVTLLGFLAFQVPKVVMRSLTTVLKQTQQSITTDLAEKLDTQLNLKVDQILMQARAERQAETEKQTEELKRAYPIGPVFQGLSSKLKQRGHQDLELYRFSGLRGDAEDSAAFRSLIFQDFDINEGNDNVVYFFWANTATTPPCKISARVDQDNKHLAVAFETHTNGGANIAIRPTRDTARKKENSTRYMSFEIRLAKEDEDDRDDVEIGFRIVNGWLQHWEYSTKEGESYRKLSLKRFQAEAMTWHKFSLDLEKNSWWHLFKSDGNYIYGPETPDFDVITSIIFEVGCSLPSGPAAALAQKPGPGKGRFELRNIRLSEIEEGHSV